MPYGVCGACGARDAAVKCPCQCGAPDGGAVWYCNKECQKKGFSEHKRNCPIYLLKGIEKKNVALLQAQGTDKNDPDSMIAVMVMQQQLAAANETVGMLQGQTIQAVNYPAAEKHYQQALHLRRAVKASLDTLSADAARTAVAKLAVDTETALYDTKICLGRLWYLCTCMRVREEGGGRGLCVP